MERWKLHMDVLLHVISVTDLKTKSRMVKTCRLLHCEGGKALLKSSEVELRTRRQILSFLLFMRADAPGRFPSIRALRVDPRESLPTESVVILATFLLELAERCSRLRTLYLFWHMSTDQWSNEVLSRAVAKLTSLTDLTLDLVDDTSWNIIRTNMLSHLLRAHLAFPVPDPFLTSPALVDLTHLLEGSEETLEYLKLTGSYTHKIVTSPGPVYPRLQTLELKGDWIPTAADYITSFPALRSLTLSPDDPLSLPFELHGSVREENKLHQRVHGSWQHLAYFMGTTEHLYLLGLTCPVYEVFLENTDEHVPVSELRAVLDDVRPVHFGLSSYANSNFLNSEWMEAVCAPRSPRMTVLKITMKVMGKAEEDSVEAAINAIRAAVASMSLVGFHLDIRRHEFSTETEGRGTYANIMVLQTVAQGFTDACPSLEAVLIEVDCEPDRPYEQARVGSPEDCRRLLGVNPRP